MQANNFIQTVKLDLGDFPPVLDIETLDGVSPKEVAEAAAIWLSFVETHYQVKPVIYSSMDFYEKYLKAKLSDYPCWIARYNYLEPDTKNWQFWQYSNQGHIKGIEGEVDLNVFYGTKKQLNKYTRTKN